MKERTFVCKRCGHALTSPRPGMTLKEAKSWFRYTTCPACKQALQIGEHVPASVMPAYTQVPLWGEPEARSTSGRRSR